MAKVTLIRVSKTYSGDNHAVRKVSLEIADREFLVLVGPSGCGKSSTLRMIAGLEEVSSGEIHIGDREVTSVPPKNRDIAMVFQNYALYPHMTVYKNIAFGLELRYGGNFLERFLRRLMAPAKARELEELRVGIPAQVQQTAEALGIQHLLDRTPKQLSGGERQRVALGRAIVRQPAAFLFDEPLSNLDAKLRVETRLELRKLHQQLNATMIYVTHDQVEAMTLGDRIVVMDQGVIQQVGTPQQVYHQPLNRFVASFLGSPPMNLIPGNLITQNSNLSFIGSGLRLELDKTCGFEELLDNSEERKVELGIRAENVVILAQNELPNSSDVQVVAQATIAMIESLGDSELVHCLINASTDTTEKNNEVMLIGKLPIRDSNNDASFVEGQTVQIGLLQKQAHLFDCDSGLNLQNVD
ncbi:MAG: ABC transporter ATP-binding protein [Pirellulales bacterium]